MKRLETFVSYVLSFELFLCGLIVIILVAMMAPILEAMALMVLYGIFTLAAIFIKESVKSGEPERALLLVGGLAYAQLTHGTTTAARFVMITCLWLGSAAIMVYMMVRRERAKPAS